MGPHLRSLRCRKDSDHVPDDLSVTGDSPLGSEEKPERRKEETGRSCRGTFARSDRRTGVVSPPEERRKTTGVMHRTPPSVPGVLRGFRPCRTGLPLQEAPFSGRRRSRSDEKIGPDRVAGRLSDVRTAGQEQ